MGLQNVDLAHERWGRLRGDHWRALEWMALRSWDVGQERNGDLPRRYWGGHTLLGYGMGLIERKPGKPLSLTKSQADRVRRAVRDLAKKHAITVIEEGRGQQHAVYELDLAPPPGGLWIVPGLDPHDPRGST
jgi:hypothetical protein